MSSSRSTAAPLETSLAGSGFFSAADRIRSVGGHPSGFDYLRLTLAVSVFVWHSVCGVESMDRVYAIVDGPLRPLLNAVLPMFFALSGFLVAGSLERTKTLATFLLLRVLRIFPALTAEVILSALVLGPIATTLPLSDYFASHEFRVYLLNIVGDSHFTLPGVFINTPYSGVVNGQLWTVPFELGGYVVLSLIAILGLNRRRYLYLALMAVLQLYLATVLFSGNSLPVQIPGRLLMFHFLVGVGFYLFRRQVPYRMPLFLASLAVSVALLSTSHGYYLSALPLCYVTMYIGLLNPRRVSFIRSGDYSYGIYLFGFPIQQTVLTFGPSGQSWWLNLLISTPFILLIAALSWHCLEKQVLKARRHVPRIDGFVTDLTSMLRNQVRARSAVR